MDPQILSSVIPLKAKIIAIALIGAVFIFVIGLIRKGKLREEYAFIWFSVTFSTFILAIWSDLLLKLSALIGAGAANSTVFFFGILFLLVMALYFTIVLSKMKLQIKNMAQEMAQLRGRVSKTS